ncbi:PTS sugar transporter subunit IIBC [Elizabethkingia miricola]|uniref:PTS sugar transporter subunit IIBC n=1 Tax=Elizabethkingia miricola TaxID=172045 RepID=UPI0038927091
MNFNNKKVSVKKVTAVLAKNDIQVNDDEAAVILDFLYLMAKNYKEAKEEQNLESLGRNRTLKKLE